LQDHPQSADRSGWLLSGRLSSPRCKFLSPAVHPGLRQRRSTLRSPKPTSPRQTIALFSCREVTARMLPNYYPDVLFCSFGCVFFSTNPMILRARMQPTSFLLSLLSTIGTVLRRY